MVTTIEGDVSTLEVKGSDVAGVDEVSTVFVPVSVVSTDVVSVVDTAGLVDVLLEKLVVSVNVATNACVVDIAEAVPSVVVPDDVVT